MHIVSRDGYCHSELPFINALTILRNVVAFGVAGQYILFALVDIDQRVVIRIRS